MAKAKDLVIVESPAKAKTIEKYLGGNFKVRASMGHLRDLPKSKLGVDIENGFRPQYIPVKDKKELIEELKKESKAAGRVYLATDPDREGEAISWHLKELLELDEKKTCRVTFNEITKKVVTESIQNPRAIDRDLVDSQQARRILDRIVGYQISPLLWKKVKSGLSAGRVQSVATRMVVDREDEMLNICPCWFYDGHRGYDKARLAKDPFNGNFTAWGKREQYKAIAKLADGTLGKMIRPLPETWKLKTDVIQEGTAAQWYVPETDISKWEDVKIGTTLELQGHYSDKRTYLPFKGDAWFAVDFDADGDFDPALARKLLDAGVDLSKVAKLPEKLPPERLSTLQNRLAATEAEIAGITAAFAMAHREVSRITAKFPDLKDRIAFRAAEEALANAGAVSHLVGWVPVTEVPALRAKAVANAWGIALRDPNRRQRSSVPRNCSVPWRRFSRALASRPRIPRRTCRCRSCAISPCFSRCSWATARTARFSLPSRFSGGGRRSRKRARDTVRGSCAAGSR